MEQVLNVAEELLSSLPRAAMQKVSFLPHGTVTRVLDYIVMAKTAEINPRVWMRLEATLMRLQLLKCVEFVFVDDVLNEEGRARLFELVRTGLPSLSSDGRLEVQLRPGDNETMAWCDNARVC